MPHLLEIGMEDHRKYECEECGQTVPVKSNMSVRNHARVCLGRSCRVAFEKDPSTDGSDCEDSDEGGGAQSTHGSDCEDSDDEPLDEVNESRVEEMIEKAMMLVTAEGDGGYFHEFLSLGPVECSSGDKQVRSLHVNIHTHTLLSPTRSCCLFWKCQVLKFMQMTQHGHGVSRACSRNMLEHCLESGGDNIHLPQNLEACETVVMKMVEELQGKRKTYQIDVPMPNDVKELVKA